MVILFDNTVNIQVPMHVLSNEKYYLVSVNVLHEVKFSKIEPLIECLSLLWADAHQIYQLSLLVFFLN